MPPRYSRHYYDLYKMAASPVKEKAFQQLELLKRVVEFKMKFYPRGWARYPDAKPEFPIVKDTTPNMMNPRLYTTSYNKPQGQQFDDTAVLSFIKLQYT